VSSEASGKGRPPGEIGWQNRVELVDLVQALSFRSVTTVNSMCLTKTAVKH